MNDETHNMNLIYSFKRPVLSFHQNLMIFYTFLDTKVLNIETIIYSKMEQEGNSLQLKSSIPSVSIFESKKQISEIEMAIDTYC